MFSGEFCLKRQDLIDERRSYKQLNNVALMVGNNTLNRNKGSLLTAGCTARSYLVRQALTLALSHIPPSQLVAMFRRLLKDLRHHRSGMPDLICLMTRVINGWKSKVLAINYKTINFAGWHFLNNIRSQPKSLVLPI